MLGLYAVHHKLSKKRKYGVAVVAAIIAFSSICTCLYGTAETRVSVNACCPSEAPASQSHPSDTDGESCCHEELRFYMPASQTWDTGYVKETLQRLDVPASATLYLAGSLLAISTLP